MTDRPEPQKKPRAGATTSDEPGVLGLERARAFAIAIAGSLVGDRCEDVVILEVAALTTVTSCIVIASGTSDEVTSSAGHPQSAPSDEPSGSSGTSSCEGSTGAAW